MTFDSDNNDRAKTLPSTGNRAPQGDRLADGSRSLRCQAPTMCVLMTLLGLIEIFTFYLVLAKF